ncbi:MAG TPA: sigma 54-interacting transcriptional regulator [Thermoanaerobaculia bacterium]|nr:sigma 54-interacting transcriptional regulator [Thermoanaerobaculia bacterium]
MAPTSAQAETRYRLRGQVGSRLRTFPLQPGENTLGSLEGNDICLPVSEVSRQHAILRVGRGMVRVEDCNSLNHVFVNGARVQLAPVHPGDVISFGPVALALEELAPGDDQLAIHLLEPEEPAAAAEPARVLPGQVTAAHKRPGDDGPMALLEEWLSRLTAGPVHGVEPLLEALARTLWAEGAVLLEGPPGREPVVRASHGALRDLGPDSALARQLAQREAREAGPLSTGSLQEPGEVAFACYRPAGGPPLWLLVFAPFELASASRILALSLLLLSWASQLEVVAGGGPGERELPGLHLPEGFVRGPNAAMRLLLEQLPHFAEGDSAILILGETGVGKELIAKAVHLSSRRAAGPFVQLNCATLPEGQVEAEFFGVAKGAATGVDARSGVLQEADGGTLFLDEIGELPLTFQAKLLTALDHQRIRPLGGKEIKVNVRIVAATNQNLLAAMQEGKFRPDFYFRLSGAELRVPPLRERVDDLPALVSHSLRLSALARQKGLRGVTAAALERLRRYGWPGNVRQLKQLLERLVQRCPAGEAIELALVREEIDSAPAMPEPAAEPNFDLNLPRRVGALERELILAALERAGGSRRRAASILGIARNTLMRKLQELAIEAPAEVAPEAD